jgi:hypothetical protein
MRGRPVWQARAADGHWAALLPQQQLLNSGALAVFTWLLLLYAMSGLVFGYLPFFLLAGFVPLQGVPAVLASIASLGMSAAMGTHLVQRHWSTANAQRCASIRRQAWYFAGICMALGVCALMLAMLGDVHVLNRRVALHPEADWMLSPLPWLWPHVLPLARERVVTGMLVVGLLLVVLMMGFMKLNWVRPAFICFGIVLCLAGAYFLGDSALGYAGSRGVAPIAMPVAVGEWRADPGLFNAGLWLAWWGGACTLVFGVLMLAACLILPAQVVDSIDLKSL